MSRILFFQSEKQEEAADDRTDKSGEKTNSYVEKNVRTTRRRGGFRFCPNLDWLLIH